MNQLNNLQHKFPVVDSIPESVRLPSQIHQRVSLVDGELKLWAGPTKKTLSPIWIQQSDGSLQQVELGSYPVMGKKKVMKLWKRQYGLTTMVAANGQ